MRLGVLGAVDTERGPGHMVDPAGHTKVDGELFVVEVMETLVTKAEPAVHEEGVQYAAEEPARRPERVCAAHHRTDADAGGVDHEVLDRMAVDCDHRQRRCKLVVHLVDTGIEMLGVRHPVRDEEVGIRGEEGDERGPDDGPPVRR